MAEQLSLIGPSLPDAPDFARPGRANDILLSAEMTRAQPRPAMTMVCGLPGCGKFTTLETLAKSDPDARLVSIAPGGGGACGVAEIIVDRFDLGIRPKGRGGDSSPVSRGLLGRRGRDRRADHRHLQQASEVTRVNSVAHLAGRVSNRRRATARPVHLAASRATLRTAGEPYGIGHSAA